MKYLSAEDTLFTEGLESTRISLQEKVKHGGGSLHGVVGLVRIHDVLTAEKYRQILIHQDTNPKLTANVIKNYLQHKEEVVLEEMIQHP